jgi:heme O synthase-like polyprenyltransferase
MAISWMYRDDYQAAGFPMLAVVDPEGRRAARQAVIHSAALWPVSLAPWPAGIAGPAYALIALVLSGALGTLALRFARARNDATARALFFGSIVYLPLLWIAMIVSKL